MKLVSAKEMQSLDKLAMEKYGIPGIVLMDNAAKAVADSVVRKLKHCQGNKAAIFCGKGNNGGDGFGAARWLESYGYDVITLLINGDYEDVKGDAAIELDMLLKANGRVVYVVTEEKGFPFVEDVCVFADVIVDAMVGTGFAGELHGFYKKVCQIINASGKTVVAVDVPTGVNADTGAADEDAIRADTTITMQLVKAGMEQYPAKELVGELSVADIGMPANLLAEVDSKKYRLTAAIVNKLLPLRSKAAHKGDAGRVVLVAGSTGFIGAAALASRGAIKAGAGLVSLLSGESVADLLAVKLDEEMVHALEEDSYGELSEEAVNDIVERANAADVLAIGPGLGTGKRTQAVVREVLLQIEKPVVIDADALTALKGHTYILNEMGAPKVLTPHPGEFSRLTGISIEEINSNRLELAAKYAVKWNAVVVLKGAATVIGCPDGTVYVNPTGCEAMATGGCGDVLTGIIAGLAGQEITLQEATLCGVYLHGLAGSEVASGNIGLAAGEIAQELPRIRGLLDGWLDYEELVCNPAIKMLE
ncbi:MAG: NAD(P)H-hydrate dehydratase [Phascolarctobacterium sp.]|nr:NAD(P)H-hydrate dehydratase [Phascolarctobacterium sp.]